MYELQFSLKMTKMNLISVSKHGNSLVQETFALMTILLNLRYQVPCTRRMKSVCKATLQYMQIGGKTEMDAGDFETSVTLPGLLRDIAPVQRSF